MTPESQTQSDMDRGLLTVMSAAVGELPPDTATLTHTWSDAAGMWFVEVTPSNPKAAPVSVAFDGADLVTITVGKTWFELFPATKPSDLEQVGAIARAVFRGGLEESGIPEGRYARIHLEGNTLAVGELHLPWPWRFRPFKRRYAPYYPTQ